jgi:EAL domain-containing protein (putative c-di-GMP-specific phosphodiesterase class I)
VIAEGVGSEDHLRALRDFGCDEGQGFLFCPPVDVAAFESWLEARGALRAPLNSP